MENLNILAIETSCDETAAAVVRNGREVVSQALYTQIEIHKEYGGVVPEIASRNHVKKLPYVVEAAVRDAGGFEQIDAIAVTNGPGLVGALLTGVSYAKGLAYTLGKPLVPVHHIAGHICANYISHPELEPPFLCLVASGGHTQIVWAKDYTEYETLGRTRDDAAGEAIDKVARVLGLPYPGGPNLQELAKQGDETKYKFPHSFRGEDHLDFSFSGLKTAVINLLHKFDQQGQKYKKEDVAASFLKNVSDTLVKNTFEAARRTNAQVLAVAGGVSANEQIRAAFGKKAKETGITLCFPEFKYCTDNAVMIASCAYYELEKGRRAGLDLNAQPVMEL
ncbi:tRNA (adenosine(37)-N6)-threonylcarbamoyltransferase complex transferase subunit TsaD [Christensenella tenuis]|uniref:tRNA N6-adenosine threonylcarbamoyltransferase n=1 Tax=Christensenella tenuis TaxID=2763033 RepID=A0ABR7EIC2_9FIRM|nr:tRNA (adenosine(37)-N6)-threonylcarbamoyltransferase complex transferase subunit TsaD [Christensenella tenuis]MBC5649433.1 tRNA (adenosine(37)-N6)-threonylcarbamoyltransferase complex transferase subunit TsaD [Christensenella tenuis]